MKKIVFALFVCLLSMSAFSQESEGVRKVFCELVGTGKFMSAKINVVIDFGQETKFWSGTYKQQLADENGKAKNFNSMVDAMNFMGKLGWDFEQAYVVTTGQQNIYHWLLSKEVTKDEELKEGITTKEDFK
nr:MAG TPA: YfaZ precursor [Caudoviricetes sp.]